MTGVPSYAMAAAVIEYDPMTGLFRRKVHLGGKRQSDWVGGSDHNGYRRIHAAGCQVLAHKLAWLLMTGSWPTQEIDHIDGLKSNNKWSNLRAATRALNNQNLHCARRGNSTGVLGVSRDDRYARPYQARICHNGERLYIGRFSTVEEARAAYQEKKRELHPNAVLTNGQGTQPAPARRAA